MPSKKNQPKLFDTTPEKKKTNPVIDPLRPAPKKVEPTWFIIIRNDNSMTGMHGEEVVNLPAATREKQQSLCNVINAHNSSAGKENYRIEPLGYVPKKEYNR